MNDIWSFSIVRLQVERWFEVKNLSAKEQLHRFKLLCTLFSCLVISDQIIMKEIRIVLVGDGMFSI